MQCQSLLLRQICVECVAELELVGSVQEQTARGAEAWDAHTQFTTITTMGSVEVVIAADSVQFGD